MTDRYKGVVVAFDRDIRDDDAEALLTAIRMLKGVLQRAVAAEIKAGDRDHALSGLYAMCANWREALARNGVPTPLLSGAPKHDFAVLVNTACAAAIGREHVPYEETQRLRARADAAEAALASILAVLNGDGGHRLEEIGAQRAADEGAARFYDLVKRADVAESRLSAIAQALGFRPDEPDLAGWVAKYRFAYVETLRTPVDHDPAEVRVAALEAALARVTAERDDLLTANRELAESDRLNMRALMTERAEHEATRAVLRGARSVHDCRKWVVINGLNAGKVECLPGCESCAWEARRAAALAPAKTPEAKS